MNETPVPRRKSTRKRPTDSQAHRTLGPIPDLERHLPSEWWRTLFNSVYLKTDGDVVENQDLTRTEIDLVVGMAKLSPDQSVMDLCCGQGRHCLELGRRGFAKVVGVDRSRYLIQLAKKRAKQEGLNVEFREGDARKARFGDHHFHCVTILGNSFGYFENKQDDEMVLATIARALTDDGTLIMDIANGDFMRQHFEPRSWEWIDTNHFVCRERSLARDQARLISREVVVHAEKGVLVDQFYAERLYDRDAIVQLLRTAGYRQVELHSEYETHSDRGQDLGMMAHRLMLTAVAPRRSVSVKGRKSKPAFPEVTVLLGDPSLPDSIKVDGQFQPEDLETVRRMKDALASYPEFRFRYHDRHADLLTMLQNDPPSFVLNLCDEGYQNDAFKELHVPAVLEMLGIPYSGAGPACLGLCYNKSLVRSIADSLDVPTPMESYVGPDDATATIPATFPALVKPNFGDSSIGITQDAVVHNEAELLAYIERIRKTLGRCSILIQEFLTGPEYTVGIIGNPGLTYTQLPILEVDYSGLDPSLPQILGYESKWLPDSPYWNQLRYREAHLDDTDAKQLYDASNVLFERLGCRDYARIDFRTDANGVIKLLEVNPNPGWCWDGKFAIQASFGGMPYKQVLRSILDAAQERVQANGGR